jgi:hypothetical protein
LWNQQFPAGTTATPQFDTLIESPKTTLVAGAAPLLELLRIQHMYANITVASASSTAAPILAAMGVFIAEWNNATGAYSTQDPGVPSDVSRDNWVALQSRVLFNPTTGGLVPGGIFDMSCSPNLELEPGQALVVAVTITSSIVANVILGYNFRLYLDRVV